MTDRPIDALAAMAKSLDQASKDAVERLGVALLAEASEALPGAQIVAITPHGAQFAASYRAERYAGTLTIAWDARGWRGGVDPQCGHWTSVAPTAREAVHALLTTHAAKALAHLWQPLQMAGLEWRLTPTPKDSP